MKLLVRMFMLTVVFVFGAIYIYGQCVTSITAMGTYGTPAYVYINKTLSASQICQLTAFNNVFRCDPGGEPPVLFVSNTVNDLTASAYTIATNPFCRWDCACGEVEIGPDDGLPVELMGFSVE